MYFEVVRVCLVDCAVTARNPVSLSPLNFKQKNAIAVEFTCLIVAAFKRISMIHLMDFFSSATQFTVEKYISSDFATTDRNCWPSIKPGT